MLQRPSALGATRAIYCGDNLGATGEVAGGVRLTEIDACFRKSGRVIIPLTVYVTVVDQLARKLAERRRVYEETESVYRFSGGAAGIDGAPE